MSNDRLQVIVGVPMSPDHGFSNTQRVFGSDEMEGR
jgi:hypothetical protein